MLETHSLKVRLYSGLFTVRCGALTHVPLKFELGYDKLLQCTVNNAARSINTPLDVYFLKTHQLISQILLKSTQGMFAL